VPDLCYAGFCDIDGECNATPVSCDDSNPCTDDACDGTLGCVHTPTASCSLCGDGVLQPGEQCDDGNGNPFDGCDGCIVVDITPD